MKILVISDSHGHIANIKTAIEIGKKANVKAIIHCGDWDNIESVEAVLSFNIPLYTVLGNADVEDGMEEYLKFNAKKYSSDLLKFEIDGRKICVIHNIKNFKLKIENLDVVFYGDRHSSEIKDINFVKFVRPGALINGINFAIYETANNEVEFINE